MARKESITRKELLQTAFVMAKEQGVEQVTARRLAARAGCSTQPIFRLYQNMEELLEEVFQKAAVYFEDFYEAFDRKNATPFVDLGMAYIQFAREDNFLFQMLFISEKRYGKSLYDLLNGQAGAVGKEISRAKEGGCRDSGSLFIKMWIFIHGAACMTLTGDYDLSGKETVRLLEDSYRAFLGGGE